MFVAQLIPLVIAGGLSQGMAPADSLEISALASAGSGLSLTGAGGKTLSSASPAFLNLEAMIALDRAKWLGLGVGAQLELQGRVGIALVPQLRAYLPSSRRVTAFASAGAPFYLFPYTLFGVSGGFGFEVQVASRLSLTTQFSATGYFAGSDLMRESALLKLDFAAGFRLHFGPQSQ